MDLCIAPAAAGSVPAASSAEAREHLRAGVRHYDIQEFADAATEFRAAYRLDPQPDYLYSLGQAERAAGNCRRAVDAYRAYLRYAPTGKAEMARKQIDRCVSESETSAQHVEPNAPPPPEAAEVAVRPQRPVAEVVKGQAVLSSSPSPTHRTHRRAVVGGLVAGALVVVAAGCAAALAVSLRHGPPTSDYGNFQVLNH
jgi:hypothetical protein